MFRKYMERTLNHVPSPTATNTGMHPKMDARTSYQSVLSSANTSFIIERINTEIVPINTADACCQGVKSCSCKIATNETNEQISPPPRKWRTLSFPTLLIKLSNVFIKQKLKLLPKTTGRVYTGKVYTSLLIYFS